MKTLEDYYGKFPYPIDIINRQNDQRTRNAIYLEELNRTNPWLVKNIYNRKYDDLPPNWKIMTVDNMHENDIKICAMNKRCTYYRHIPSGFGTMDRPPSNMKPPSRIGKWYFFKDPLSDGGIYFTSENLERINTKDLPNGWTLKPYSDDVTFEHTSGLEIEFFPSKEMHVKQLKDNWYYYKDPRTDKDTYFNNETGEITYTKPDDA
jgi:hypothetical protein